jgi:polysaccharide chain length determinant protein (PEP-CTERM system associated)
VQDLEALVRLTLAAFWRWRWSMVLLVWVVCLVGWLGVALLPNQYTSTAQIYVDTESVLAPLMKNLSVSTDIDKQVETMRKTLLTRPNLLRLIQMADLKAKGAAEQETLVKRLAATIDIKPTGRNLFAISYSATDPGRAYRVVDAVLQIFIEQNVGIKQRDVDDAEKFISKQIVEYEASLREAELTVARFKREHSEELGGIDRAQRELENAEGERRRLESELQSAVWQRDQLRTQLASVPRFLSPAEAEKGPSPAEQRLIGLQAQLDQILLTYTEHHPDVIRLRSLIEQARGEVAQERAGGGRTAGPRVPNPVRDQVQKELDGAEANVKDLNRRIELARQDVERLTAMVAQAPEVQADLTRLTRDYNVMLDRHKELIERREAARLAKRLNAETNEIQFRITDPPVIPTKPSGLPHGLMMAGVLVAGIGSGLGWTFLRLQMDRTLQTVKQLSETFGLPILGAVSLVHSAFDRRLRFLDNLALGGAALGLLGAFAVVFYLYQLSPTQPDIGALTQKVGLQIQQYL